ncbi:aminotransferase class I/II-fold pyridoxal phosphate-dependent enzyme [Oscillospiraceae bacterium WX1]
MQKKIYLAAPHMSDAGYEQAFVREAFETNWIAPLGANVDGFERELAEMVGARHAAALSSGTAAIHMALLAAGVARGDTVVCQSLTFAASANPIVYLGAVPVFVDSSRETWNLDPEALETALKKYKPKAVIAVHLYGLSADMDAIVSLCRRYHATLIEDAAESLGTLYKGCHTGTFGDFGVYSFNGNKIITTSGGGMVVSDKEERINKIKFWATQSRDPARHYQHSELGYNYRLSNVLAGIGRGQLKVLGSRVDQKRAIYDRYQKALAGLEGVAFMPDNAWDFSNRWLSCLTLGGPVRPAEIIEALERENIESRPIWKPLHCQPFYKACETVGGAVAESIFNDGVCLPSDTRMTVPEQDRVIDIIRDLWRA